MTEEELLALLSAETLCVQIRQACSAGASCAYQKLHPRSKRGFRSLPWPFEFDAPPDMTTLTASHIY